MSLRVGVVRRWKTEGGFVNKVLSDCGLNAVHMNDSTFDPASVDVAWFQGNINWFPRSRQRLTAAGRTRPRVIVWHSEPLPLPSSSGFPRHRLTLREMVKIALRDERATDAYTNARRIREMCRLGVIDLMVVSARSRQEYLSELGIESHFIPLGLTDSMGELLDLKRDIDVLFIGALERRQKAALRHLRRNGIEVEARGSWKGSETWGTQRTELINRAKIFLNVQRSPGQFSGYRLLLGMGNGAMVISEPIYKPSPYVPGRHFISVDLDEMPGVIRHYLDNDSERERIAREGYRFAVNDLRMEDSIRKVVALMNEVVLEKRAS